MVYIFDLQLFRSAKRLKKSLLSILSSRLKITFYFYCKKFIVLAILLATHQIKAQNQDDAPIKYSGVGTVLPFDREFQLEIPLDNADISYTTQNLYRSKNLTSKDEVVEVHGQIVTTSKKSSLLLNMPPLSPNSRYYIPLRQKINDKSISRLFKLKDLLDQLEKDDYIEVYLKFEKKLLFQNKKIQKEIKKGFPKSKGERLEMSATGLNVLIQYYQQGLNLAQLRLFTGLKEIIDLRLKGFDLKMDSPRIKNYLEELVLLARKYTSQSNENDVFLSDLEQNLIKPILEAKFLDRHKRSLEIINVYSTLIDERVHSFGRTPLYNLHSLIDYLKEVQPPTNSSNTFKLSNCFNTLRARLEDCDCPDRIAKTEVTYVEASELLRAIDQLDNDDSPEIINHLIDGILPFGGPLQGKRLDHFNYVNRLKNIGYSILKLERLQYLLRLDNQLQCEDLENIIEKLYKSKNTLADFINTIQTNEKLDIIKWIGGATRNHQLKIQAGNIITSNYGIGYSYLNESIIRPNVGISIHLFGPINKDVRFRDLKSALKTAGNSSQVASAFFRYHFTLDIGMTFGSLEKENRREDLYAKNNLFIGSGITLARGIKMSLGTLIYKAVDPNFLIDDESNPKFGFYSGLSFNLDFKNAAAPLAALIFK